MADDKEKTQRRVYVLPTDLVERIVAYQNDMGLQSEVEAARRLLDEALKRRDDWRTIARRFLERLKDTRVLPDIAKDVLIGHPMVQQVSWSDTNIVFITTTGETVRIERDGTVYAENEYQRGLELDPKPLRGGGGRDLDDEIPF